MKKTTLFAALLCASTFVGAQNTTSFETLLATETFDAMGTDGITPVWPAKFSVSANGGYYGTGASKYHGSNFKDFYSNIGTTTLTTPHNSAIDAAAGDGTLATGQSLKLTATEDAFTIGKYIRLRVSSPAPVAGETYVAVFNIKTDAAGSQTALLSNQDKKTPISSTWSKQILQCGVSGAYIIPIEPLSIGSNYNIWIDNLTIKRKPSPVITSAATAITTTEFTANWAEITGSTTYKVFLYTTTDDGATWTAVSNATPKKTNYTFTGLTPNTMYGYRVTATDGELTTGFSPTYEKVTTLLTDLPTSINETKSNTTIQTKDGLILVKGAKGQTIEVYNSLGQKETSMSSIDSETSIPPKSKGVHIVKVGKTTQKVVL